MLMAPLSGTKNFGPPKGFLMNNPMFWTYKIILVMKRKKIMDGSACSLCLKNIAYCMLPMQELQA